MSIASRRLRFLLLAGTALTLAKILAPSAVMAQAVTNLSGSTNTAIANGQTLADTQNAPSTYSGVLSGLGAFSETGSSTLTLTNSNTFTGGTTINSGTLALSGAGQLSSTGAIAITSPGVLDVSGVTSGHDVLGGVGIGGLSGSGSITIGNNELDITQAADGTFSGAISGNGALTKQGTGTLSLTGTNSFAGIVAVYAGTLAASSDAALGTGSLISLGDYPSTPATLQALGNITSTKNLQANGPAIVDTNGFNISLGNLQNDSGLTKIGTGILTFTTGGNTGFNQGVTVNGGTLALTGAATLGGTGPLSLANGTTFNISGASVNESVGTLTGAGNISLGANGLSVGETSSTNYTGIISGTGGLTVTGGGTLTLGGINTYSGGTDINGATVSVSTSANVGSNSGTVTFDTGGGTLLISNSSSVLNNVALTGNGTINTLLNGSLLGNISGAGSLTKIGVGTLTLGGTNTYTGGTILNAGTLSVTAANNLGSGSGALTFGGGTLSVDGSSFATTTFTNNIVLGTGGGTINNGTSFNTALFSGAISGSGSLTLTGGITSIEFTNANNTYTGGTTVTSGTVYVGANNALGTGPLAQNSTSALTLNGFNQSVSVLTGTGAITASGGSVLSVGSGNYSGAYTGAGSLIKTGTGTLTLTGANSYTGGTTISGGILAVPFGGNLPGNVVDNATLQFSQNLGQNGGDSALISGTGALLITGGGQFTASHTNTYTGGTTITAGTFVSAANNAAGTGALTVASGATFNQATFNQTVNGIAGTGTIASTGGTLTNTGSGTFAGTLTSTAPLVQSSGFQAFDGASTFSNTTVSGGMLEVGDINNTSATLTSPVTVASGGTLLGHGTIIGNVTNSGGTVRPGGSIGTLSVNGNYSQDANSILAIEVSPAAASKLAVTGGASLAGTLALTADAGTYAKGTTYQIVSANSVTGAFTNVTETGQAVPFSELYTPNAVDLVVGSTGTSFAMGHLTPNESNALGAIESILPATSVGAFQAGLTNIGLATGVHSPQLAGALGELRADLASVDLANLTSFQNFLVERMDRRQGLTSTMEVNTGLPGTFDVAMNDSDLPLFGPGGAVDVDAPSVWTHGYGVLGQLSGETGYAEAQYRTGGIAAGIDAKVSDATLLGAAVAYEHTDLNLSGDSDENTIDTYRISLYGSQKLDPIGVPLTLDAALGYAFNDYHDNDFLALPGSGFSQTSRHDGNELTAATGLSQDVHVSQDLVPGALTVVPRLGIEYDNIQQNPYSTTGAPVTGLDLATNGSTLNALRSTIGARADLKLTTDNGTVVTPELRASYLHDFMDTNVALTEVFAGAPTTGFKIAGVHPGREAALVGTGVTVGFSENVSATIGYDAAVRDHELDHTVQVGVKYTW